MSDFVDIGLPDKMDITRQYNSMTIVRNWFGLDVIFITFFAVIWNGIIFRDYQNFYSIEELPWIHIMAGVLVSYYAVMGWFNKTDIHVSKQQIKISHKPLPWIGNKNIDATDIKQLYGKEKVSRNSNNSSITYEVHVIMNSGSDTKLISGLKTSEQALYVEQEIEKYLGIKNKPVRGELG